ncbi:porin family protein [Phaeodactylibacter luteus]|uniref:PorT family protein n=1 Tax=Phaeodactylibacter luteus TaxID=1564516 RepID=A0A5C6RJE8_9BACT|nr:porin family protein [Phaeodactylibacter luteus]TXB61810.1 PorT family protein [Phaeodactylibacter luteus]
MKNHLMLPLLALLLLYGQPLLGQVRLGVRGGMFTTDLQVGEVAVPASGGSPALNLDLEEARFGIQAGLVLQIPLGEKLLLQPEALFNSNRVDYQVEELSGSGAAMRILSEKYQTLDLPMLLQYRLGPLRVAAGPVGHLYINSTSDLLTYDSYEQRFDDLTYGYQAGIGLDIWNLMFDFRYEGNFTKFGDHIYFNGERYAFSESPARLQFTVGLLFGK